MALKLPVRRNVTLLADGSKNRERRVVVTCRVTGRGYVSSTPLMISPVMPDGASMSA